MQQILQTFRLRRPVLRIAIGAALGCILLVYNTPLGALVGGRPELGLPVVIAPADNPQTAARIALGKRLFFDARLSRDGSVSCSSCHRPEQAFSDGRTLASGIAGREGTRNTPSLLNVAFNTSLFWDGRESSLERQALLPLTNPLEQGLPDVQTLMRLIRADQIYVAAFRAAFGADGDSIRKEQVTQAIAAFERTLICANSPFDRYAFGGDTRALSEAARQGLELFKGAGHCTSCHLIGKDSALFTDNDFHSVNIGLQRVAPRLPELTRHLVDARQTGIPIDQIVLSDRGMAELGHFVVTLRPADIGTFRTPSLRNVALTAPYMHDGSVPTLEDAVEQELYLRGNRPGRPLILTPGEKADLVEFLKALTSPGARSFARIEGVLAMSDGKIRRRATRR